KRVAVRLATLAVHEVGQLVQAPGEYAAPLQEVLLAAVEAELLPPGGGIAGRVDGRVHVGLVVDRVGADDVPGGGVERVEGRLGRVGAGLGGVDRGGHV